MTNIERDASIAALLKELREGQNLIDASIAAPRLRAEAERKDHEEKAAAYRAEHQLYLARRLATIPSDLFEGNK